MQIYLVMGDRGAYSDYTTWPVKAFKTHDKAMDFAIAAAKRQKEIDNLYTRGDTGDTDYYRTLDDPKWKNEYDSEVTPGWDETSYTVSPIELEEE